MSEERDTCELCRHNRKSECRYCELTGEPNPEAFSRQDLVDALMFKARVEPLLERMKTELRQIIGSMPETPDT